MTNAYAMEPPPRGGDGWRAELRATLRLSWPLAAANLLQMLTYAIDVIFIARLGDDQLAASALAVALFGLVLWALSGLTGAVAPVAAAELGERAPALRAVRRSVRMALWLALFSGTAGIGVCLLLGPLMRVTGQQPHIIAMAIEYNTLLVVSLVPMLFCNVLRSLVSTLDRPIFATAITAQNIVMTSSLLRTALLFCAFITVDATISVDPGPVPVPDPARPKPYFSWDYIPLAFHGANHECRAPTRPPTAIARNRNMRLQS